MKYPSVHIEPWPQVLVPSTRSWRYFCVRHLPVVTSGVAAVAVIWLWASNLPEATGSGAALNATSPIGDSTIAGQYVVELLHTNTALAAVPVAQPNGNRLVSERLAHND